MCRKWLAGAATLILLFTSAAALRGQDGVNTCSPNDPPWGKNLASPDDIVPTGGVLDTSLVVRKKETCVPVWSTNLCQGTYLRCLEPGSTAAPCSTSAPCANARTCLGDPNNTPCTKNGDCTTGAKRCVKTWGWDKLQLRTYGHPVDPKEKIDPTNPTDPNLKWTLPGPTLHARPEILTDPSQPKSPTNPAVSPGTRVRVGLYNYLDPQDYANAHKCEPAGPPSTFVPTYPECFHGPEITNLHYHGTHVSPQPHQDYVLLNLWPFGSTNVPINEATQVGRYQTDINPLPWNQPPGTHWYHPHKHGSTALQVLNGMSGALLIDGPFDDWLKKFYKDVYKVDLVERLLLVQQVQAELNFLSKNSAPNSPLQDYPPQLLVNGQATPVIGMQPGEIQRFRFVGATVEASAAVEIGFDERIKDIRQIAQDGVQFAWQNYDRQPYHDSEGTYSNFDLAPGNRADFLIKAPTEAGTYVIEHTVFAAGLEVRVRAEHRTEESVADRIPDMAPLLVMKKVGTKQLTIDKPPVDKSNGNPLLFTIVVSGASKPMDFPVTQATDPACAGATPPLRCWPKTPSYLQDLTAPQSPMREIDFSVKGTTGPTNPPPNGTNPPSFYINRTQYTHDCAGAAMARATTEDWQVGNVKFTPDSDDVLLPHPFHIHVNPFQMIRNADRTFQPPYVWQDTVSLPVISQVTNVNVPAAQQPISSQADAEAKCPGVCDSSKHATWTGGYTSTTCACQSVTSRPAGPIWSNQDAQVKCPRACATDNSTWNGQWRTTIQGVLSECDCVKTSNSVHLRQAFEDYTGAYVIHCHFLGHEDRGMMWNVETVCGPSQPWKFGTLQQDGGPDNCGQPAADALECCPDENGNTNCGPR